MKQIHLTYCGMDGSGPTVREAKADAARKIQAVLELSYQPIVVQWRQMLGMCWNTPAGVVSGYVHDGRISGTCHHSASETLDDAVKCMRLNMAQVCASDDEIETGDIPAIIKDNAQSTREYRNWLGFVRAYRDAKATGTVENGKGTCDHQWHQWACHHGHEYSWTKLAA